jgi:iron complex outermembrane receptor protein
MRLGWRPPNNGLSLALVGQNLLQRRHPESGTVTEIERGVYGKVTWQW